MAEQRYDSWSRMAAAIGASGQEFAAEVVREMVEAEPDISGAEVLERLQEAARAARAEVERLDALKDR